MSNDQKLESNTLVNKEQETSPKEQTEAEMRNAEFQRFISNSPWAIPASTPLGTGRIITGILSGRQASEQRGTPKTSSNAPPVTTDQQTPHQGEKKGGDNCQ